MIRRYLREHLPLAGLLALFAGTFALVLSLYHLPTEPVAYASALCAVMGLIALIWGFVRYRRAHQARAHVLNAPHLLLDELPSPRTLSEADDQAIMQRLLHDVRAAQSDLAAYRQDSTDYFTAWVHQIKTPLSVMRLQLQSEDTPENREQAYYDMAWLTENMIMRNRTHGGYKVLLDDLWEIVTEFNADMVILWEHMSCKALDGMHGMFEQRARELGIHLVWVSHDLFDPRVVSRQGVRDQINTYMRTVMGEEPVDPTLEVLPDEESW